MYCQCPLTGHLCFDKKSVSAYKIINGQLIQFNLCNQCASQTFVEMPDHQIEIWRNFLRTIFHLLHIDKILTPDEHEQAVLTIKNNEQLNQFLESLAIRQHQVRGLSPCPICNTELHQLLSGGRLGCANCYTHFVDFIKNMIDRVQAGATKHEGKKPKTHNTNIKELEKEMDLAVKQERYEDAAKYRDKIKELKSG